MGETSSMETNNTRVATTMAKVARAAQNNRIMRGDNASARAFYLQSFLCKTTLSNAQITGFEENANKKIKGALRATLYLNTKQRNKAELILVFLVVLKSGERRGKGLFYVIKFASRRARILALISALINRYGGPFIELFNLTPANKACKIFHSYCTPWGRGVLCPFLGGRGAPCPKPDHVQLILQPYTR